MSFIAMSNRFPCGYICISYGNFSQK